MALYKGTKLYKYYLEQGWIGDNSNSNQLLNGNTELKYVGMTEQEFKGLQRCFPLYARLNKSWYPEIQKAETDDMIFRNLRKVFIQRFYS